MAAIKKTTHKIAAITLGSLHFCSKKLHNGNSKIANKNEKSKGQSICLPITKIYDRQIQANKT
jgi:hypothetical protein